MRFLSCAIATTTIQPIFSSAGSFAGGPNRWSNAARPLYICDNDFKTSKWNSNYFEIVCSFSEFIANIAGYSGKVNGPFCRHTSLWKIQKLLQSRFSLLFLRRGHCKRLSSNFVAVFEVVTKIKVAIGRTGGWIIPGGFWAGMCPDCERIEREPNPLEWYGIATLHKQDPLDWSF